jgi:tryptophan synthase alpha chain
MSRITPVMAALKSQGRKALIPYLMAGFPHPDHTLALMHALVEGGADIIELGVPFSDPMADGPVIQEAGEEALRHHVGMAEVLAMVRGFRATDSHTPIVLMGYANPVESYNLVHGEHGFVKDAAAAGVDGVLVVDYPPEECVDFAAALKAQQMDLIFLLAPTSTEQRMQQVAKVASGYVYYVSLKGVTGSGALNTDEVEAMLPRIRQHVHIPVGVGFGIRDAATAQTIGKVADAVVIGSKLIQLVKAAPQDEAPAAARDFMRGIRQALDA